MDRYEVKAVQNPHNIIAEVPGSKSITNRALLIAALAKGTSHLKGVLFSDDSRHFLKALQNLGFSVAINEEMHEVSIEGLGGEIPAIHTEENPAVYVGSAGTAARFLTAYLALSKGTFQVDSSEQMKKRPMKELLEALSELGAGFTYKEEPFHFPFEIQGNGFQTDEVTIDVDKSSQFLSALLIVSVLSERDFTIHVKGSHGMAYVHMTIAMMKQFGVSVVCLSEREFLIPKNSSYSAMNYQIEPDVSAACYFYGAGAILGVEAKVKQVKTNSLQGDVAFLRVLQQMGCTIEEEVDGIRLMPSQNGLHGGKFDLSTFSDQTLTLAAIAPFVEGNVEITGVSHIRMQECDRIHAIIENLKSLGIEAEEKNGNITIQSGDVHGGVIKTYEDHRVAMAFSLPGLMIGNVTIENPACCRKTFENYFEVLEQCVYRR